MIEQKDDQIELLPEKMIFTQSILWGEKGLFRKTGISPLNLKKVTTRDGGSDPSWSPLGK